jgi:hypothetical protein
MSNKPHGETDNRLRDRPKLSNTRVKTHPAIATNEDPSSYDPSRAKGVTPARAGATDNGVSVPPRETSSRPKKAKLIGVAISKPPITRNKTRVVAASIRIMAADEYLLGNKTMTTVAEDYHISRHTARDWVNDRRETFEADHGFPPPSVSKREMQRDMAITSGAFGTGGNMSNDGVRRATRDLEKAIIKMQKKRGMPTFTYRKEDTI